MNQSISQLVECPRCGNRFELSETFRKHFEAEKQADVAAAVRDRETQLVAAQQEREEAIRAELVTANEEQLAESAEREKALQEQLQANQEAQAEREAQLRADLSEANQAQLAESAQRLKALQEQMQENQEVQAEREAQIRAEADAAAQKKLAESQQRTESLQAREQELLQLLQNEQAERALQEKLIREQVKEEVDQQHAVQREQDALEKQRLRQDAEVAQAKLSELQRRIDQGPVELQGEALEVYLKRLLQEKFPFDQIEDIGRGQTRCGSDAGGQ